jgi:hypothetical protein
MAIFLPRVTLALMIGAASASAQAPLPKPAPTPDSLAAITRRGIALAQYDVVAWHASDAVMALRPADDEFDAYIARRVDSTWSVVFGHLSSTKDAFWLAYEATQVASKPDSFRVRRRFALDTGYYARGARALDVARRDFGQVARPYNAAVIPSDSTGNGEWFVYFVPAQTRSDLFPLGGDVRYSVSADGRVVRAKRQLHKTTIEFGPGSVHQAGSVIVGMHTAVLDDYPEDTDVFHVLVRTPHVGEYIVSDAFVFSIGTNGVIRYLGRRQDVLSSK